MTGPRWYRVLLFLLPRDFRRAHGEQMAAIIRRRWLADAGFRRRSRVVRLALSDLVATAVREWRWRFSTRPPEHHLRSLRAIPGKSRKPENTMLDFTSILVRDAFRRLSRQWATSLLVVVTLALGLGSTVAIYSYVHAALVRPLPFDHAEQLVRVWPGKTFSKEFIDRFRNEVSSYDAVAGYSGWLLTLTGDGQSEEVDALAVTPGFFEVLSVRPSLGRPLRPSDSSPGAEKVVVLSDALWRSRFAADPEVLGGLVDFGALDGDERTADRRRVVGILPARYESVVPEAEIVFPLVVDPADEEDYRGSWYLKVVGRLRADIDPPTATNELAVVARRLKEDFRGISEEELAEARTVPLQRWIVGEIERPLLILLGAVAMVLLVACTNVASLLIARTMSRQQELRLRTALGANRRRLVAELLCESAILAALSGVVGVTLALGFARIAAAVVPLSAPRIGNAQLDAPVLGFALAVTTLVALLAGLPAAWRVIGRSESAGWQMRSGSRRVGERAQLGLIVVEVALTVMLLVGAGLVLESFTRLLDVDTGFESTNVTALRVAPPTVKYEDTARWRRLNQSLLERIRSIPGVTRAGGIHLLPLTLNNWNFPYAADAIPREPDEAPPTANFRVVLGDYFETLQIPLLAGRLPGPQDREGSEEVVVINETMANHLWGVQESIGRELLLLMNEPHRIVGVVGDVRQHELDLAPFPEMYYPVAQNWSTGGMTFMVRSELPPEALFPSLREAVRSVDPAVAVGDLLTMDQAIARSVTDQRSLVLLLGAFGVLAIFLSLVGVYSVVAFLVGRRVRDIGIRMALGARRTRVVRDGVAWFGTWVAGGLVLGGLGSVVVGRLLGGLLYQAEPLDLRVMGAVLLGVALSATVASIVPIRRASRLDPARVLRSD